MIRFLWRLSILLIVAYLLGYALFALLLPRPAGLERTDAIVVLTGGTGRLDRGFDLMRRRLARRMLVSGVDPRVRPNELAAAYHVEPRLIACWTENSATSPGKTVEARRTFPSSRTRQATVTCGSIAIGQTKPSL